MTDAEIEALVRDEVAALAGKSFPNSTLFAMGKRLLRRTGIEVDISAPLTGAAHCDVMLPSGRRVAFEIPRRPSGRP